MIIEFLSNFFLCHSAENFRRGILYCCITFGYQKSLEKSGGGYQGFPSKIFCLTVPKFSVGTPLLLHYFRVPKKFGEKGGGVSRISVEIFLSHSAEIFRIGILYCCKNFGCRKILDKRGGGAYHDFPSFFVPQCRKFP